MIGEEVHLEEIYGYWSQSISTELQDILNIQADDYIGFFNYLSRFETIRINEVSKIYMYYNILINYLCILNSL